MKIAIVEGNQVKNTAVFKNLETAREFLEKGFFPGATEVAACPYGYGIGDIYEHGTFSKADGTEPALEPPPAPPKEPEPTAEEDLMALSVDHEYRLTLLELGVI